MEIIYNTFKTPMTPIDITCRYCASVLRITGSDLFLDESSNSDCFKCAACQQTNTFSNYSPEDSWWRKTLKFFGG